MEKNIIKKGILISLLSSGIASSALYNKYNSQSEIVTKDTALDSNEELNLDIKKLCDLLTISDIPYIKMNDKYYTKNGENLVGAVIEKEYDALQLTDEDGSIRYTLPEGGILVHDKGYIRSKIYFIEGEKPEIPEEFQILSIEDIIPTYSYNELANLYLSNQNQEEIFSVHKSLK